MDDVELGSVSTDVQRHLNDGYPAIADFVARDPDHESFVFRRFAKLTARKLMYMQSELLELEQQLEDFDHEVADSDDYRVRDSSRCWEGLVKGVECGDEGSQKRMELIRQIEVRLSAYHEALLQQKKIANLDGPPQRVISAYREALHGGDGKDCKLGGKAKYMLDDEDDPLTLKPAPDNAALSEFARNHWTDLSRLVRNHWIFKMQTPRGPETRTRHFEGRYLTYLINTCSTVIAAVLLIGSILALDFVKNADARLGIVLGFIVLFALGLSIVTNASREAIFAATAAYSAVLIVYISGDQGAKQQPS